MRKSIVFLLLQVLLGLQILNAQTWTGALNSSWNNAANWSPATVPGPVSQVVINLSAIPHQPILAGNVHIAGLDLYAGQLDMNGYQVSCSGMAMLAGGSLVNGKLSAASIGNLANMQLKGKIVLEKTGVTDNYWNGHNTLHGDSLIILWHGGTLHLQTTAADSLFGNFIVKLADASTAMFADGGNLYIQQDMILDNTGNGSFSMNSNNIVTVAGNLLAQHFSAKAGNLYLHNLNVSGAGNAGIFYCHTGELSNCVLHGSIKLVADSAQPLRVTNAALLGKDNYLQAGALMVSGCRFGQPGMGSTTLSNAAFSSHEPEAFSWLQEGKNVFLHDVQMEAYAASMSNSILLAHEGDDSCMGNLGIVLKGIAGVFNGASTYVHGNMTIDAQGTGNYVQLPQGPIVVDGNFSLQHFSKEKKHQALVLRHIFAAGSNSWGTVYCSNGDISSCGINGNIKILADDDAYYYVEDNIFKGRENYFAAKQLDITGNYFGEPGAGIIMLGAQSRTTLCQANNYAGNTQWDVENFGCDSSLFQEMYDIYNNDYTLNVHGAATTVALNALILKGDFTIVNNDKASIVQMEPPLPIVFSGTDTSSYTFKGCGKAPIFKSIEMNRTGGLRLLSPLTCNLLTLTRGILLSSCDNPVEITAGGSILGGSDSSYIDGPVLKTGNSVFTFPVGKNKHYAPIGISAPACVTDQFKAEYFAKPACQDGYDTSRYDASLHHLSHTEYWTLARTNGNTNVQIILSWQSNRSGSVNQPADLRVARWSGQCWKDEGNGGTTGANAAGSIQTLNSVASFGAFTLASATANNALPVTYLYFIAERQTDATVLLQWQTVTTLNNAYFQPERSTDGQIWQQLGTVAASSTQQYRYTDALPLGGTTYYRLHQVDQDGNTSYSITRLVGASASSRNQLLIWPNPIINEINIQVAATPATINILDMNGRVVQTAVLNKAVNQIPAQQLKAGMYIIQVETGGKILTVTIFKN